MVKRPAPKVGDDEPNGDENGNEGGRAVRKLDPLIRALLSHVPMPHSVWPPQERQKWIALLSEAFGVIYKDAPDPPKGAAGGTQHSSGPVSPPR